LLGIPEEEKKTGISDRITEAISLLLGRTPRLDTWARQFYKTRSEIVHQGKAGQMRFVAPSSKKGEEGALYHPLLSFGRQLFQMCASVLLVGERIAETAGLEDKLVTNQERFEHLCRILSDEATSLDEKIATSNPIIFAIERYRYVGERNLRIETMLAAARFVAAILAESDSDLPVALRTSVAAFARTGKSLDHFDELETLKRVKESIPSAEDQPERPWRVALRHLVEVVWGLAFMHYYWLKQKRETSVGN